MSLSPTLDSSPSVLSALSSLVYPVTIDGDSQRPIVAGPTRASRRVHPSVNHASASRAGALAYENVTACRIIDAHPTTA